MMIPSFAERDLGYYYLLSIVADHAYTKTGHVNNVVYVRYAEVRRCQDELLAIMLSPCTVSQSRMGCELC